MSWPAEKQPKYREWIEWATREVDRLDPFVSERRAYTDRKHELGGAVRFEPGSGDCSR